VAYREVYKFLSLWIVARSGDITRGSNFAADRQLLRRLAHAVEAQSDCQRLAVCAVAGLFRRSCCLSIACRLLRPSVGLTVSLPLGVPRDFVGGGVSGAAPDLVADLGPWSSLPLARFPSSFCPLFEVQPDR